MCRHLVAAVALVAIDASLALAGAQSLQSVRPAGGPHVQLLGIQVERAGDEVLVRLRANGPLAPADVGESKDLPPRIYLDLPGVAPGTSKPTTPAAGSVRRVRVAINSVAPLVTRIVLDLKERATYRWESDASAPDELAIYVRAATDQPVSMDQGLAEGRGDVSDGRRGASGAGRPLAAAVSLTPGASPLVEAAAAAAAARFDPAAPAPPPEPTSPAAAAAPTASTTQSAAMGSPAVRPWGRASFYTYSASASTDSGSSSSYAEFVSALTYQLPERSDDGLEYGIDFRHTGSTVDGREPRLSIYDGFVGGVFADGRVRARVGHMWLNDLGALGAVAGALVEARQSPHTSTPLGRWRVGMFGGLEPNGFETGYVDNVRKIGSYVALEGNHNRRSVLGYVNVRNASVTERSVLSFTNYLPMGQSVYVYQAGEYDLTGPAGQGHGGLTYFFTNVRGTVSPRVELLGTYNRGRSIDARSVSDDVLAGRPVSQRAVEGLLYESIGGRVTVEVLPRVRVYTGYSRDRNNSGDAATGRWLIGGYGASLFGSGFDLTVSDSRIERPTGSYHSSYISLGRQIGRRVYLTGDYTTSLSLVRFLRSDGVIIEMRPHTSQFGASGVVNLNRAFSLLVTIEDTLDAEFTELRLLSGLTYRFR